MSASIARYLKDFGSPPPPPVPEEEDIFAATDMPAFEPPVEEVVDIEAERAQAHARGRDEATEEQRRLFDEERAALLAAHTAEIEELRAKFETELAEATAAKLSEFAAAAATAVADQTATVLAPLLDEAIVARTVADLAELLRAAILEGEIGTITVRGPLSMFEQLSGRLGEQAGAIRHVEAPEIDLTVEMGEASLVTRMSAWSASLKKVLE